MDNLDDCENNAKVSDSAYSNSCTNSQSRRSRSSKSAHSGSNSSGSSGYGGKPSTSSSSNDLSQQPKKEKELKKKKQAVTLITDSRIEEECRPEEALKNTPSTEGSTADVLMAPPQKKIQRKKGRENIEVSVQETNNDVKEEGNASNTPLTKVAAGYPVGHPAFSHCDGFSCVISMHDGVVLYTTSSLTSTLGFPKDMLIGRSFIDFVHPRDREIFASQVTNGLALTNGLAVPNINHTQEKGQIIDSQGSSMICRIRRYRGLNCGFGVKNTTVPYMPFLLKFRFKNISDDKGTVIYLVIQTVPFFSAFKTPNEVLTNVVSFLMRHSAEGNLEYIDSESVPYLGYLPQDIINRDALLLYHPGDLAYLHSMYESIVKDDGVTRSKPYRMMTQNGHFIKVESEWSSFINPWSRKLEFVTGKYYVIEGPANPDVFHNPEQVVILTDEQENQAKMYREGIIRIMKDVSVLTKPAEVAKQQMSKHCQDLALFMEILMEEEPKAVEDLRLDVHDADQNNFERDSVMLGGISPHREYNDSKSSTETPLSYNQLNYNDNLQRYFNSHQPNGFVDNDVLRSRNPLQLPKSQLPESSYVSPAVQTSGDSAEMTSSGESGGLMVSTSKGSWLDLEHYQNKRLTEYMLTKHNAEMEKELMNIHREHRSFSKGERDKVFNLAKQKKNEHLARCNATFHTKSVANSTALISEKPHNLKRPSKPMEPEPVASKHHCPVSRHPRRRHPATSGALAPPAATLTNTLAPQWSTNPVNNVNTFILGVGMSPQMPVMNPLSVVSGMFPMYCAPATASPATAPQVTPSAPSIHQNNNQTHFQQPLGQCMMYGQPMYGQPIMYSAIGPQNPCFQQTVMGHGAGGGGSGGAHVHYANALNPLCLANSNYQEACRSISIPARSVLGARRDNKGPERLQEWANETDQANVDADSTSQNPTSAAETLPSGDSKPPGRTHKSEDTMDRTDGESSFSSFYSSFFKTESGSADDSSDVKKAGNVENKVKNTLDANTFNMPGQMKAPRRKMDPPWAEQVCVTSELIYKYQVMSKSMEEVLSADKLRMKTLQQPTLVNEQLGQLYADLQLEGVAARLTLEEGITSSSSSGEDTAITSQNSKKKREYSKLVMIHEENAPLPPPPEVTSSLSANNMSC